MFVFCILYLPVYSTVYSTGLVAFHDLEDTWKSPNSAEGEAFSLPESPCNIDKPDQKTVRDKCTTLICLLNLSNLGEKGKVGEEMLGTRINYSFSVIQVHYDLKSKEHFSFSPSSPNG